MKYFILILLLSACSHKIVPTPVKKDLYFVPFKQSEPIALKPLKKQAANLHARTREFVLSPEGAKHPEKIKELTSQTIRLQNDLKTPKDHNSIKKRIETIDKTLNSEEFP